MTKITEGTINSRIESFLSSSGLSVTSEVSAQTADGRRQPDFRLGESGVYYGEGEWQSSYLTGYNQAIEYGDIPGAAGYFVLGYPDALRNDLTQEALSSDTPVEELFDGYEFRGMFKCHGQRPALFTGTIDDVPGWIQDALSEERRAEETEEYIRLMRELVEGLTEYIPDADEYPSMFEHIVADMPQDETEATAARDAAAYLLLNQVVFYRILQEHGFPELNPDDISNPRDLRNQYFEAVLEVNYEAIFDFDVVALVPPNAVEYLRDMIRIVVELRPEEFTRDLLGSAFHELIPLEVRKPVAAYYTNPMVARLLARLTVEDGSDHVGDLACGSGTLLMSAYEEKQRQIRGSVTEEVHREFVESELTGVDIMPFAAHLAAVQLGLRNPGFLTDKPRIAVRDSTSVTPGDSIDALQEEMPAGQSRIEQWNQTDDATVEQGAVSSSGEGTEFELEPLDVVLMNPPFTRKQHIDTDYRETLRRRFSEYEEYVHPEMGFYGFFVLLADQFVEPGGRVGFVLPAAVLQQQSLSGVRKLLSRRYELQHLVVSDYRAAFSEDSDYREVLIVARHRPDGSAEPVTVTTLQSLPNRETVDELAVAMNDGGGSDHADVTTVDQSAFDETLDWMSVVREHAGFYYDFPESSQLTTLGEATASVIGGIRYNESSEVVDPRDTMLSEPRDVNVTTDWRIDEATDEAITATSQYTGATVSVPTDALGRGLRSLSGVRSIEIDDAPDKIVLSRFEGDEAFWAADEPDQTVSDRRDHVDSRDCRLVVGGYGNLNLAAGGTSFLAVAATEPVAPTWSMWAVETESARQAKLLALWLNSTYAVARLITERNEVEGTTMKWRKGDLTSFPVPDTDCLTEADTEELLELYEELSNSQFPSLSEQLRENDHRRTRIDSAWADALGWTEHDETAIERLQQQVADVLGRLAAAMQN